MPDLVLQRVIFPASPRVARLYYFAGRMLVPLGRRSVRLEPGTALDTGTYFNSFFECYWRQHTRLGRLLLKLRVSGEGTARLMRRTAELGATPLEAVSFCGDSQELVFSAPPPRLHFRELGALSFALTAGAGGVTLHQADWLAADAKPDAVRLVVGCCTFNREEYILDNLKLLCSDESAAEVVHKVVVVDQGTRHVQDHPAFADLPAAASGKVMVIEQKNFGGAGGFTRSMLEAQRTAGATHVLLMDDDVELETESVLRAARFLALAQGPVAVGGNMLDLLRPRELFELSAEVHPHLLAPGRAIGGFRIDRPRGMKKLLEVHTTRYNGWWFMAFPLSVLDQVGLPLPFFIRCDDIEFGCRLDRAGIPISAMPGIAIWHAPFYLKYRGWQNYYELRNMLVLSALYHGRPGRLLAATFLRRVLKHLLGHDYYEAWLACEAVQDYCKGPAILDSNPQALHQRLLQTQAEMTETPLSRSRHLPAADPPPPARSRLCRGLGLIRRLLRETLRPTPARREVSAVLVERPHTWWRVARTDVAVIVSRYGTDHLVLRRSRGRFLHLLGRALAAALVLSWRQSKLARLWQNAFPRFSSAAFWHRYLGLDTQAESPSRRAA